MNELHNVQTSSNQADVGSALERLFELASLLGDLMDGELTGGGLSKARAEVLWALHHGGPMTQRQLSQALRCTPRNVTGLLDALQAVELVARGPHPTDRRATVVTLTDQGAATVTAWHDGYQTATANLFAGVPAEDLDRFVRTLGLVVDRLRGTDSAGSARDQGPGSDGDTLGCGPGRYASGAVEASADHGHGGRQRR